MGRRTSDLQYGIDEARRSRCAHGTNDLDRFVHDGMHRDAIEVPKLVGGRSQRGTDAFVERPNRLS